MTPALASRVYSVSRRFLPSGPISVEWFAALAGDDDRQGRVEDRATGGGWIADDDAARLAGVVLPPEVHLAH
jgi:hypothetical protein